jgi:hypothetical protein
MEQNENCAVKHGKFNPLVLQELADDAELIEVGRKAIEDRLIEWRDDRLSELGRGNGFVVREVDGTDSTTIRFGPETGLKIAIKAMAEHLTQNV